MLSAYNVRATRCEAARIHAPPSCPIFPHSRPPRALTTFVLLELTSQALAFELAREGPAVPAASPTPPPCCHRPIFISSSLSSVVPYLSLSAPQRGVSRHPPLRLLSSLCRPQLHRTGVGLFTVGLSHVGGALVYPWLCLQLLGQRLACRSLTNRNK